MKRFQVIIEASAYLDIEDSYLWGRRVWGLGQADKWARELRRECLAGLSAFPERCSIAPESEDFSETIRQKIVGRYRILFAIRARKVHILHVRGSANASVDND